MDLDTFLEMYDSKNGPTPPIVAATSRVVREILLEGGVVRICHRDGRWEHTFVVTSNKGVWQAWRCKGWDVGFEESPWSGSVSFDYPMRLEAIDREVDRICYIVDSNTGWSLTMTNIKP